MAHVVILTTDTDGKIRLSKDELQKMLDDAYSKGYSDGKTSSLTSITYPSYPIYYTTNSNKLPSDHVEITCQS